MKLALRERQFPTKIIRKLAAKVYGRQMTDKTWGQWKTWAGCPGRRHWLNGGEAVSLLAIAHIRSTNQFGELERSQIQAAENEVSFRFLQFVLEIDNGMVLGRDAIDYLADYFPMGCGVSRRKLYRRIPKFSAKAIYPKRLIVDALVA